MKYLWITFILLLFVVPAQTAGDWPQYMGPNRDGSVADAGVFDGEISLKQLWSQPLGSGFSGVVVSGDRLYAMHTAGEMDALSCFEVTTGKRLWSHAYGPTFPKVGSSEPGPLSTPVLDGNHVYGVGAYGELFCLDAETGKLIWKRHIVEELGAVSREVGIGTSPLVIGNHLILNVGDRKDKAIAAFHKKTGELAWHLGAEEISFQSPALMTAGGRQQVVALSESKMRGLEPATGELIWERDSKSWLQAMPVGENLMLSAQYHGLVLHRFKSNAGELEIEEIWNNPYLVLAYDMPVHHKGYLFGFNGPTLSCLRLQTGERLWSTGEAGGGLAILVDGHLAIMSSDGLLRIARAWENGYQERASIEVFEDSGLTAPSYADGVFYLRNYTHLVAVKVN